MPLAFLFARGVRLFLGNSSRVVDSDEWPFAPRSLHSLDDRDRFVCYVRVDHRDYPDCSENVLCACLPNATMA